MWIKMQTCCKGLKQLQYANKQKTFNKITCDQGNITVQQLLLFHSYLAGGVRPVIDLSPSPYVLSALYLFVCFCNSQPYVLSTRCPFTLKEHMAKGWGIIIGLM